jgi:hypothetical protein
MEVNNMKRESQAKYHLRYWLETTTLSLLVVFCWSGTIFAQASTYYFPHLALGAGWQTTITLINYSPQTATCETDFFSDSGAPLQVPFSTGAVASRSDALVQGGSIHIQTTADLNAAVVGGWARTQCDIAIKASLLFRRFQNGVATGEAGVNAMTTPTTKFVSFAEHLTGVAYANPSADPADVKFTVLDSAGDILASKSLTLVPNGHGAANLGPLLGLTSFTGSVQIVSSVPIVSLSLNFEADPAFSSLPPGDLGPCTALSTGSGDCFPSFTDMSIQVFFSTGTYNIPCGIDLHSSGTLGGPVDATLSCPTYPIATAFEPITVDGLTLNFTNNIYGGIYGYGNVITDGNMSLTLSGSTVNSKVSGTLKIVVNNSSTVQGSLSGAITSIK